MKTAICRTPAFPRNSKFEDCWPALKNMIRDSSKSFFDVIAGFTAEEIRSPTNKAGYSVWKYFNRARMRATPFGSFAAVSTVPVTKGSQSPILRNGIVLHSFEDWSWKDELTGSVKKLIKLSDWFQTNSTLYFLGDEIRYVFSADSGFELNMIGREDELQLILLQCRNKSSRKSIDEFMAKNFQMSVQQVDQLLCKLVSCQLLLTDRFSNITGQDYFSRLQQLPITSGKKYVIGERKLIRGAVDEAKFRELPAYLNFISEFLPQRNSRYLTTFSNAFLKKFDRKVVPLALALDPETGVGYGDLAQRAAHSDMISESANSRLMPEQVFYGPQIQFLWNACLNGGTIALDKYPVAGHPATFPNTMSVMMHYWNGSPVMESAGGCTANALLGRFTLALSEVDALAREIAGVEARANPDMFFFDVAYQAEKNVDNVNRRQRLYEAELPILSWSLYDEPLNVDDILVAVNNREIILWSKKHRKRMVPRIPSAYNYSRSDLSIYRFLCDLQGQGLHWNLDFRIEQLLPGLEHYPRVMYKDIIVSPARWQMGKDLLFPLNEPLNNSIGRLQQWLRKKKIDELFRCGSGDQTLCFDPANELDLAAFVHYRRQNSGDHVYMEEALLDLDGGASDEDGNVFMSQYILNYFHEETVYPAIPEMKQSGGFKAFGPGSQWLYFEIYCHESRSDQILINQLRSIVRDCRSQLVHWFFIRYSDPAPHIRLRFELKDPSFAAMVMGKLHGELHMLMSSGLVSDLQIKTYFPENERYGADRMKEIERFFSADSKYVLDLLLKGRDTLFLYQSALELMEKLCGLAFTDVNQRLKFARRVAAQFSSEFALNKDDYQRINAGFKTLPKEGQSFSIPGKYEKLFSALVGRCKTPEEKESLVADLLHLHINRLFSGAQRRHETVLYQYLVKRLSLRMHISAV